MPLDITSIIQPVGKALSPLGSTLSDAWQLVLGDRVATWRLMNAAKLQEKINLRVSELGLRLNLSKIPDRYAFSWFEKASKQDDTEIQNLFVELLIRAAASEESSNFERLLNILSQMTPSDAINFRNICLLTCEKDKVEDFSEPEWVLVGAYSRRFPKIDSFSVSLEFLISIGLLERHHVIEIDGFKAFGSIDYDGADANRFTEQLRNNLQIQPHIRYTSLGVDFYEQCLTPFPHQAASSASRP